MNTPQLKRPDSRQPEPPPNAAQILETLERIRLSATFANAEKLLQFLEFVVYAVLRGESKDLKETVIGVDLFGRSPGYDPKQDGIVRTQASRLRDRLDLYYTTEGIHDPVVVRLRKGSYAPVFEWGDTPINGGQDQPEVAEAGSHRKGQRWLAAGILFLAAALGVLAWSNWPSVPQVTGYTQLTHDGAPKWLIGTDGVRIYHGTGNFTNPGLAQVSVNGGESAPIRIPGGGLLPLGLSAGGDKVLVSDYYPGNLWSFDLLSGLTRRLGTAVGPEAAWSPDGKSLAYIKEMELWVAAANGTEGRKLVAVPSRRMYAPQWSPDGKRLRFTVWEKAVDVPSLWEVSADGSNLHPLLPGWREPSNEERGSWSPDGSYYVFQSQGQIWGMTDSTWLPGSLIKKPFRMTNSPIELKTPVLSPDGRKLFAVGRTVRGALVRHDFTLGQWLPYLSGIFADCAAFSADGQWIAYVSYPDLSLWRCKRDGTARLRLSDPPLSVWGPRWSPDGKRIICSATTAGSNISRVYMFSVEGGPAEVVYPEAPDGLAEPSWFPDGGKVALKSDLFPNPMEIQVLDLATRQKTAIPGSKDTYLPLVSPDGKHLTAIRRFPISIVIYNFETGKWSELARVTGASPTWSRDGKYIYFLRFPDHPAILKIRVSDGTIETAADLADFPLTVGRGWLGLAPDDSPLLLKDAGAQDIYALDLKK